MKLSKPKLLHDLYDFLPPDGEDEVEFHYKNGVLNIDLFYESLDGKNSKKIVCFNGVLQCIQGLFPGFSFFTCESSNSIPVVSSIIEYEYSELLEKTINQSIQDCYKHYGLVLNTPGFGFNVIAKSVEIID